MLVLSKKYHCMLEKTALSYVFTMDLTLQQAQNTTNDKVKEEHKTIFSMLVA
jgi:hypothetical protein